MHFDDAFQTYWSKTITTATRTKTTSEEVGESRTDPDGSHESRTEKSEGTPTILPPTTPETSTNKGAQYTII